MNNAESFPQPLPARQVTSHSLPKSNCRVDKRAFTLTARVAALAQLVERYTFFTPAPAYVWGRFSEAILADFLTSYSGAVEFLFRKFDRPIFRGLTTPSGDPDWNHALWAVENSHWQPLADHLCASVVQDVVGQHIFMYAIQELEIADPLFVDRSTFCPAQVPLLTVQVVGVRSDRYTAAMFCGKHVLLDPPVLKFLQPDDECTLYARALFQQGPIVKPGSET